MRKTFPLLLSILVVGCATAPTPAASSKGSSPPCAWPESLDAVVAAPGNHKVLFENEQVRVLDVTVAPGESEPLHAHCRPSVLYVMSEGIYRDYDAAGNVIEEQKVAPPASAFPVTLWMGPQAPHAVENLDTTPVRLLRVELKK
jgi:hypothetical protein